MTLSEKIDNLADDLREHSYRAADRFERAVYRQETAIGRLSLAEQDDVLLALAYSFREVAP